MNIQLHLQLEKTLGTISNLPIYQLNGDYIFGMWERLCSVIIICSVWLTHVKKKYKLVIYVSNFLRFLLLNFFGCYTYD